MSYLQVFREEWRQCIPFEIHDRSELGAFSYKICLNFFLVRENFPFSFRTTKYAISGFRAKTTKLHSGRNSWPVGTSGNLEKKFRKFFFLPKEFYLFFLDYLICYLQVLVQKYLHCILTKILDLSEKRAFSYKHCLFFLFYFFNFFYRIFHVYLRSLNILPTSFQAKMKTLHSFRNSWPVGTRGMFVQNLTKIFFLSKESSQFFLDH